MKHVENGYLSPVSELIPIEGNTPLCFSAGASLGDLGDNPVYDEDF
ncbi:MAG: hypothetical protein J6Y32_01330 [Bacteroidales bacterium]|nr:hypothetical protein [Bacteroidales bacterium]